MFLREMILRITVRREDYEPSIRYSVDKSDKRVNGGSGHAMSVTLEFIERDILMAVDEEHSAKQGVLLVTTEHLHFTVARK